MSATARKRKEEVAQALKKLIQAKGKTPAMKYQQLLNDLRGQSETVNVLNGRIKITGNIAVSVVWTVIKYINTWFDSKMSRRH